MDNDVTCSAQSREQPRPRGFQAISVFLDPREQDDYNIQISRIFKLDAFQAMCLTL